MVSWRWNERWLFDASAAYTRGENRTDGLPLAQIAPLESRLSVNYTRRDWSLGGVLRAVTKQERVAIGQGSIVGQDLDSAAIAILGDVKCDIDVARGLRRLIGGQRVGQEGWQHDRYLRREDLLNRRWCYARSLELLIRLLVGVEYSVQSYSPRVSLEEKLPIGRFDECFDSSQRRLRVRRAVVDQAAIASRAAGVVTTK
jgi:hypothetical protein